MELKVNGKELQVKFNFASLKLWEEKIVDADGNKQSDDAMFDRLFTGLVQKDPRTLVNIFNGDWLILVKISQLMRKYSMLFLKKWVKKV